MSEKISDTHKFSAGRRIKMVRALAGISRKELEEKYGINSHTLQSWELGRNPLPKNSASRLVEIFHSAGVICSIEWLLDGSGKSPFLLNSEVVPYPPLSQNAESLLDKEHGIQKEIDFFKTNNPNAIVIMVSDDTMEPRYSQGHFVGGIQYIIPQKINECMGQDCIVETSEGVFFRRLVRRKNGYALASLNPQTTAEEPVLFTKHILAATPIIWHRWKFKASSNNE